MLLRDAENRAESPLYVRLDPGTIHDAERTVDVIASTQTLDSHGTILRQNWDLTRFQENPVILWAHDRNSLPIAKATKIKTVGNKKEGKRLEATIQFPPEGEFDRSDEVFDAIRAGLVRGVSVGFYPHSRKWETEGDREILVLDDNELLEISFVPVGSNPDALAKMRARALAERDDPQQRLPIETEGCAPPADKAPPGAQNHEETRSMAETKTDTKLEERFAALTTDHQRVLAACGVDTVEKALGVIEAGRAATVALKEAEAKLEAQTKAAEEQERSQIVAKLESEKRITPAQKAGFCASASLETLREFAKDAPVIAGTSATREPPTSTDAQGNPAAGTKSWDEMSNQERHALFLSDRDAYEAIKPAHLRKARERLNIQVKH